MISSHFAKIGNVFVPWNSLYFVKKLTRERFCPIFYLGTFLSHVLLVKNLSKYKLFWAIVKNFTIKNIVFPTVWSCFPIVKFLTRYKLWYFFHKRHLYTSIHVLVYKYTNTSIQVIDNNSQLKIILNTLSLILYRK